MQVPQHSLIAKKTDSVLVLLNLHKSLERSQSFTTARLASLIMVRLKLLFSMAACEMLNDLSQMLSNYVFLLGFAFFLAPPPFVFSV